MSAAASSSSAAAVKTKRPRNIPIFYISMSRFSVHELLDTSAQVRLPDTTGSFMANQATRKRNKNPVVTEERMGALQTAIDHFTNHPPTSYHSQPLPSTHKKSKHGGKRRTMKKKPRKRGSGPFVKTAPARM
jgi:hypothetical protein